MDKEDKKKEQKPRLARVIKILGRTGSQGEFTFCCNCLIIDSLSFCLKPLILMSSFTSICISLDYQKFEKFNAFEVIILILTSTTSMLLMVSAYDMISMYLTIELQSLCFYVLASSNRNSEFSTEAGIKYFILGAFSSGIVLFGSSIIYGFTGLIHFEELAKLFSCLRLDSITFFSGTEELWSISLVNGQQLTNTSYLLAILLGILFLAIGFLFKLTAVPFHSWAPDVYEGCPTSITAFFLITPKVAIFGLFLRLFTNCFTDFIFHWQYLIIVSSVASMILASVVALAQKKIKRLLVYSAIAHVGYLLLGCATGSLEGTQAIVLYLIVYVITTINVFSSVLSLRQYKPNENNSIRETEVPSTENFKYIDDLHRLSKTNPLLSMNISLVFFSLAGIPPLAGFIGKFYLFFTILSSSLYVGALIGVITSVISCFYSIRLIKIMYFNSPKKSLLTFEKIDKEKSLLIGISLYFIVLLVLDPSILFMVTQKVSLSI